MQHVYPTFKENVHNFMSVWINFWRLHETYGDLTTSCSAKQESTLERFIHKAITDYDHPTRHYLLAKPLGTRFVKYINKTKMRLHTKSHVQKNEDTPRVVLVLVHTPSVSHKTEGHSQRLWHIHECTPYLILAKCFMMQCPCEKWNDKVQTGGGVFPENWGHSQVPLQSPLRQCVSRRLASIYECPCLTLASCYLW